MKKISKAQAGMRVDKTSTGAKRDVGKDIKAERSSVAAKNKAEVKSQIELKVLEDQLLKI